MKFRLGGVITADDDKMIYDWYGIDAVSPRMLRDALASNPAGEAFVLEVDSGGGDFFAGAEMYTMLRSASCETVAEVQSLAGSAASMIPCGADRTLISPVAQFFLHFPSTEASGNQGAMEQARQMLESVTESLINSYAKKAGRKCTRARFRELCAAETFLPAQDAIRHGLADGYLGGDEGIDAAVLAQITACTPKAAASIPSLAQLRAAYAAAHQHPKAAHTPPASRQDADAARQYVELEKLRFGGTDK